MPPELPPPYKPIHPLTSFFAGDDVGGALQASGFDIHEEMETLVRHFRDTDPNISLRAHSRLRHVLREVAQASGLIQRQFAEATETHEGRKVKISIETNKLVARMNQENIHGIINQEHPEFASTYHPATLDSPYAGRPLVDRSNSPTGVYGSDADGTSSGASPLRLSDSRSSDLSSEPGDFGADTEDNSPG